MHISPKYLLLIPVIASSAFAIYLAVSHHYASKARGMWKQTAFIVIDIQNDYFKGGAMKLVNSDRAGRNAGKLLAYFRTHGVPVIHVRHENTNPDVGFFLPDTDGARIHQYVSPASGETVILKHYPDSFMETGLGDTLNRMNIEHLVLSGMQSNVCIRATALKALEKSFTVTVAEDTLAAVDQPSHTAAVEEITKAGAIMTSSKALMKR